MKKYLSGVIALVFAVAASAFSLPDSFATDMNQTQYHWFDAETGIYLGQRTESAQELQCPGEGENCASAYTGKTPNNEPAGSFFKTVQRLP